MQIEIHYRDPNGQAHIVKGTSDGGVKVPAGSIIDQVVPVCELPDDVMTAVLTNGTAITFHGGDGSITSIADADFYQQPPTAEPTYTDFEKGERQALLEVRSFIIKHGTREVDAYCAQRLHDIAQDAKPRPIRNSE